MRACCSHASYSLRLTWSETVLFSVPMRFSKLPTEDCRLSSVEFKLLFSDKILSSTYDQNVSMRAKRLKQKHIVIECFFGFTRATLNEKHKSQPIMILSYTFSHKDKAPHHSR